MSKNPIAGFISFAFFLTLAAFSCAPRKRTRWLLMGLMGLSLIAIYVLQSRMTLIGVLVGLVVFWLAESFFNPANRTALRMLLRIFAPITLVILILLGVYRTGLMEALGSYAQLFTSPMSGETMQFRLQTWQIIGAIFEHEGHILRGLGIGAFYVYAPLYGFPVADLSQDFAIFHPHNLYLDITFHFGIIGLLLFLFMILRNLFRLWRGYRHSYDITFRYLYLGLFCGLTAFYVHGVVDLGLNAPEWWLYFGLATAVPLVAESMRFSEKI